MNGFGPDGGQILADCIKQNSALEEFNINSNRLNTPNAFAIAQALLANDSMQVLKVSHFRTTAKESFNRSMFRLPIIRSIAMVHWRYFSVSKRMNRMFYEKWIFL